MKHKSEMDVEETGATMNDKRYQDAQKRVKALKKFYTEVLSWVGTSVFLIGLNYFLSGNISWAKYPVFFWGLSLIFQMVKVVKMQRLGRDWEDKMIKKLTREDRDSPLEEEAVPDLTDELLKDPGAREKEAVDLQEYRKLKRPWEDKDLV